MKIQNAHIRISDLKKSDVDFLKSMSGREIRASVIRGGDPGQTALLKISDRTLPASIENNSLTKGSILYLQVTQRDGQFVLRLLGMEVPFNGKPAKSDFARTSDITGNLIRNIVTRNLLNNPDNRASLFNFFKIVTSDCEKSGLKKIIDKIKNKLKSDENVQESEQSNLGFKSAESEKLFTKTQMNLLEDLTDIYYNSDINIENYIKEKNEKYTENKYMMENSGNDKSQSGMKIYSRMFRFEFENLGKTVVLFTDESPDFINLRTLILGNNTLRKTVMENKENWMRLFKSWNLTVADIECISLPAQSDKRNGISEGLDFTV